MGTDALDSSAALARHMHNRWRSVKGHLEVRMSFPEVTSPGQLRFRLDRQFGPAEARALVEMVATVSPGSHLSFDFSRVREFQDRAIGALAQLLARLPGAQMKFHGLSLHQRRMFRYFGVDVETRNEASQPEP